MVLSFEAYEADHARYTVSRAMVQRVLAGVQPLAIEALGLQAARHVLWDGWLPVNPVMTTPDTNGGWGELMPVWFKPYERPVPLYCLGNWALFADLYRDALGLVGSQDAFNVETLLRVILAADILIPFLPSTQGMGRFLRHGALAVFMGICWLDAPARDAWLTWHAAGARALAHTLPRFADEAGLDVWLVEIEASAFLVPERARVTDESRVRAFLADEDSYQTYVRLLQCLCLSVTTLADHYGVDWRDWMFQAINLHYQLAAFGLREVHQWLQDSGGSS